MGRSRTRAKSPLWARPISTRISRSWTASSPPLSRKRPQRAAKRRSKGGSVGRPKRLPHNCRLWWDRRFRLSTLLGPKLRLELAVGGLFVVGLQALVGLRPGIAGARAFLFQRAAQHEGGFGIVGIAGDGRAEAIDSRRVLARLPTP